MGLHEVPDLFRDRAFGMAHLPFVDELAEVFGRAIEEGLLLRCELHGRNRAQLVPIGRAGEEFGVIADSPCIERLLLGIGHARQNAAHHLERGLDDDAAANGGNREKGYGGNRKPRDPSQHAGLYRMQLARRETRLQAIGCKTEPERPRPQRRALRAKPQTSGRDEDQVGDKRCQSTSPFLLRDTLMSCSTKLQP